MLGTAKPLRGVFGETYNAVAGKLLGDVCGFLVGAAGINPEFRARARELLAQDVPAAGDSTSGPVPPETGSDSNTGPGKETPAEAPQPSLFRPQSSK